MTMAKRVLGVIAACLLASGCASAAVGAADSSLIIESRSTADGDVETPVSCEDLLDGGEEFEVDEHGLVEVHEGDAIVCLDTIESVEAELDEIGREEDANELRSVYAMAFGDHAGDPDPQPNLGLVGVSAVLQGAESMGDPDPQPNRGGGTTTTTM